MEFHFLLELAGILGGSQQIFFKHGKLMASITLLTILVNFIFFLCYLFSAEPLIHDFLMKGKSLLLFTLPGSPRYANLLVAMTYDIKIFTAVEWSFIIALYIVSLFSSTVTILASGAAYGRKKFTVKALLSRALKSWKRPLITKFYISLFSEGFILLALQISLPFFLYFNGKSFSISFPGILLILAAFLFMCYLAVVWNLALVFSVLEETYGFEALGKAGHIVKGMKLKGFLLNLLFEVLSSTVLLFVCWKLLNNIHMSKTSQILYVLVEISLICLIKMFLLMGFTIFYHLCKKFHGEEIQFQGSLEYSEVQTEPGVLSVELP